MEIFKLRSQNQPKSVSKIYHFHLAKTAGTTVNRWLDLLVDYEKTRPAITDREFGLEWAGPHFYSPDSCTHEQWQAWNDKLKAMKKFSWAHYNILHSHINLLEKPIEKQTYIFSILRDPVQRVVSQYNDWHRLVPPDYQHKRQDARDVHDGARKLPFMQFVEQFRQNQFFRFLFEDGMCRAILQNQVSYGDFNQLSPKKRASLAYKELRSITNFVGLTEALDLTLQKIATDIGQVSPHSTEQANVTNQSKKIDSSALVNIDELVRGDQILYGSVKSDFFKRIKKSKNLRDEISSKIKARLSQMTPTQFNEFSLFHMNNPLIGAGFYSRDSAGTKECCCWVGPHREARLFIPVPMGKKLRIVLLNKGWVDPTLRDGLRFTIDGKKAHWKSLNMPEVYEVFSFEPLIYQKPWAEVGIHLIETRSCENDKRKRGFNLWKYGYEVLSA